CFALPPKCRQRFLLARKRGGAPWLVADGAQPIYPAGHWLEPTGDLTPNWLRSSCDRNFIGPREYPWALVTGGFEALHLTGLWRFQPHLSRQSINPLRIAERRLL